MGTHNGGAHVSDESWKLDQLFKSSAPIAGGDDPEDPKDPTAQPHEGDDVELEDKPISATPRRYKVLFHNDDYTTMEFVVEVLKRFFHKTDTEAVHIMLTVHKSGAAVAGVYTATSPKRNRSRSWTTRARTACRSCSPTEPE